MKKIFTWTLTILFLFGAVFSYYACGDCCAVPNKFPRYYFTESPGFISGPYLLDEYGLYLNPYTSNLDVLYKENSFFFRLDLVERADLIAYGRRMTETEIISFRKEIGDTIQRVYDSFPTSSDVCPDTLIRIDVITLEDYGTYKAGNPINDLVILGPTGTNFSQTPWRNGRPRTPLVDFNNYKRVDRKPCHGPAFSITIRKKDSLPSTYHRLNGLPLRVKLTYAKWRHLSDRPDDTTTIELKQYPYWFD